MISFLPEHLLYSQNHKNTPEHHQNEDDCHFIEFLKGPRNVCPSFQERCVAVVTKMNANPTNSSCKILEGLVGDAVKTPGRVISSTLVNGDLVRAGSVYFIMALWQLSAATKQFDTFSLNRSTC